MATTTASQNNPTSTNSEPPQPYIPPYRRNRVENAATTQNQQPQIINYNERNQQYGSNNRSTEYRSTFDYSTSQDSYGYGQRRFQNQNNKSIFNNRSKDAYPQNGKKKMFNDLMPSNYSSNRFGNNSLRDFSKKTNSVTGTGWDIRGGRNWRRENEYEIFASDNDSQHGGTPLKINFESYDNIPVQLAGNENEEIVPLESFKNVSTCHPLLHENILRVEYEKPTPVQKFSIPVILAGRDLMACAQTGSGKTAAFLFPIITKMLQTGPPENDFPRKKAVHPVVLILSPTRELTMQTYKESCKFAYKTGIMTQVVYGGAIIGMQIKSLSQGTDICVATPGRLMDLLQRGYINLQLISYLVLDEADRMLDMGFSPQIYSIVDEYKMPSSLAGRQTVMFSATFPTQIQKLAGRFLKNYLFLTVGRVGSTNTCITQNLVYSDEAEKVTRLMRLLKKNEKGLIVIFVETKRKADLIEQCLLDDGVTAVSIHGDKTQDERESALFSFKSGQTPILVATDVAARGLDIPNITHVINCDLPSRIEDYIHRIGRTGRAGNAGKATSLVNESNKPILRDLVVLLEKSHQEIPSWFYKLVEDCTYRSFNNCNTNKYTPVNADSYKFGRQSYKVNVDPTRTSGRYTKGREEEEDGW